jgi:hypothetical protein
MFILNPNKRESVAHLWLNGDTVCKLYSTSKMRKKKLKLSETTQGKKVCHMCQINNKKLKVPFVLDKEYEENKDNYVVNFNF